MDPWQVNDVSCPGGSPKTGTFCKLGEVDSVASGNVNHSCPRLKFVVVVNWSPDTYSECIDMVGSKDFVVFECSWVDHDGGEVPPTCCVEVVGISVGAHVLIHDCLNGGAEFVGFGLVEFDDESSAAFEWDSHDDAATLSYDFHGSITCSGLHRGHLVFSIRCA